MSVLNVLGAGAFALWLVHGIVFIDWMRRVGYPERSFPVRATDLAVECAYLAFAGWAVAS